MTVFLLVAADVRRLRLCFFTEPLALTAFAALADLYLVPTLSLA
jgi:hypothetical protein